MHDRAKEASMARRFLSTLGFAALSASLGATPLAAQAPARGAISNLRFAIEQAVEVRTQDPQWLANGGSLTLRAGERRAIRAVADSAGSRVYPSVFYTIGTDSDWLYLDNAHEAMGTVVVGARPGTPAGRRAVIVWRLARGFDSANGPSTGQLLVTSAAGDSTGIRQVSADAVVRDLYRAILLREPDRSAQTWIETIDRDGAEGLARVARAIATSSESRTLLTSGRATPDQRLDALYKQLQGRNRREISIAEWDRSRALLQRGQLETLVLDLLWSDAFFARTAFPRPASRPASWLVSSTPPLGRFHDLDRDGDGRVARSEWRGSDVAFANHDWNRDGFLSGLEVEDVGSDDSPRFDALDRNRNGVLSRVEWPGHTEDFSRLDHDRDDTLSRAEFESPPLPTMSREDRWRALDRNRDGVLHVTEMRGAEDLFYELDDDNDRVVTRAEYLDPAASSRLELFTAWDRDDSGYLLRGEWYSDTASFNALDADLDGRVSLREFLRG
jgi:hypothetical protein